MIIQLDDYRRDEPETDCPFCLGNKISWCGAESTYIYHCRECGHFFDSECRAKYSTGKEDD